MYIVLQYYSCVWHNVFAEYIFSALKDVKVQIVSHSELVYSAKPEYMFLDIKLFPLNLLLRVCHKAI